MDAKIGVVTISDRAHAGIYDDESGPAVIDTLNQIISSEWISITKLIPDEKKEIERTLVQLVDVENCCSLILNLPGSPKAIHQTLIPLFESIPACIDLMDGPFIDTNSEIVVAFRPKHR